MQSSFDFHFTFVFSLFIREASRFVVTVYITPLFLRKLIGFLNCPFTVAIEQQPITTLLFRKALSLYEWIQSQVFWDALKLPLLLIDQMQQSNTISIRKAQTFAFANAYNVAIFHTHNHNFEKLPSFCLCRLARNQP